MPWLQKWDCKVPILLFGSQEDGGLPETVARVTATRHPGVQVLNGLGDGKGGVRVRSGGLPKRGLGVLRKCWEINNLKAAALPFSLHFPLNRLSNQFAPRNMLIANGAH